MNNVAIAGNEQTGSQAVVEFKTILQQLTQASELLKEQKTEEATASILAMSDTVDYLHSQAKLGEHMYAKEQQVTSELVKSIISDLGLLNQKITGIQQEIAKVSIEIHKDEQDAELLNQRIGQLVDQMRAAEVELAHHRRKLDELNDKSAASIVRSIFCLGLDRAIMGIITLVDQDEARIRSLNDERQRYRQERENDEGRLNATRDLLSSLQSQRDEYTRTIKQLEVAEDTLHQNEKAARRKLAYFTDISLFYGKLQAMCEGIETNIASVADVVQELNDAQPRIVDIDASGSELISLKAALYKFDALLGSEPIDALF
ncbi:hypothetical protein IB279_34965 [Ensifer sp. ENS06]|uniref:hypothetical protein n=1 Tax=Ensifer sp. ENS06 TaxID=2769276 RepID=UPI00177EC82F|nr:hypothetical protein [Ensifer sp. ENS06]MBD9628155.1 hypothetical protein [Ensifer sp. ENS06]